MKKSIYCFLILASCTNQRTFGNSKKDLVQIHRSNDVVFDLHYAKKNNFTKKKFI